MLSAHRRLPAIALALVVTASASTAALLLPPLAPAFAAEGRFICLDDTPADREQCEVGVTVSTNPDGRVVVGLAAGGGGWATECQRPRRTIADASEGPEFVDCNGGATVGWYSAKYDCYFIHNEVARHMDPADERVMHVTGTEPGDPGTIYRAQCFFEHYVTSAGWFMFDYRFLPPGDEPGPTEDPTAGLIADVLDSLDLHAAAIGTAPPAGTIGLVRLPVWLWNQTDDTNWGTNTAQVSEAGITAQATAEATEIVWDMGNGQEITCDEGVAWQPSLDYRNPPCGYPYPRASRDQPGETYTITATTTWQVEWSVTGPSAQSGSLTLHPETTVELQINELQVLVGQ